MSISTLCPKAHVMWAIETIMWISGSWTCFDLKTTVIVPFLSESPQTTDRLKDLPTPEAGGGKGYLHLRTWTSFERRNDLLSTVSERSCAGCVRTSGGNMTHSYLEL